MDGDGERAFVLFNLVSAISKSGNLRFNAARHKPRKSALAGSAFERSERQLI
jgi:hypothetical protein